MDARTIDPNIQLTGTTAVVTGANSGIGFVTARELARAGAHVILACRNHAKAQDAILSIKKDVHTASLEFLSLDLSSLASVRQAIPQLCERQAPIDILVNNAGLAGGRGHTADGYELAFGVNHLGHFALTLGILDAIRDGGRIVNVSSVAHYRVKRINWNTLRHPKKLRTGFAEYAVSKLANVLFTARLARELAPRRIDCYGLHPGVIASDVWRNVPFGIRHVIKQFMISNDDGARTTLYCATAPEVKGASGLYWDTCKPKTPSTLARDIALQNELWNRSLEWTAS